MKCEHPPILVPCVVSSKGRGIFPPPYESTQLRQSSIHDATSAPTDETEANWSQSRQSSFSTTMSSFSALGRQQQAKFQFICVFRNPQVTSIFYHIAFCTPYDGPSIVQNEFGWKTSSIFITCNAELLLLGVANHFNRRKMIIVDIRM